MRKPRLRLLVNRNFLNRDRATSNVQLGTQLQCAASDALDFLSTEKRDYCAPLGDGGSADLQGASHIRASLKVIENSLFKHNAQLTTVYTRMQPYLTTAALTSVAMDRLSTLAERLKDAMGETISASDLARECHVSPAAVSKWLDGTTKRLKADNYACAARAMGVRDEWLRTGKLPREREHAEEERQEGRVIRLLEALQEPLAALSAAVGQLTKARPQAAGKREKKA